MSTTNTTTASNPLTRSSLASDLSALRSLPTSTLSNLLPVPKTDTAIQSQTFQERTRPIDVLNAFSPKSSNSDQSQTLVRAYISEMKSVKSMRDGEEGERVGERIDRLRERGEEIVGEHSEIRVRRKKQDYYHFRLDLQVDPQRLHPPSPTSYV
ncbi:hypothetical protein CI109_105782 [Kwoniella shandongensis]|uniref:Uncharacterized protein n=1 Tax=Kwoniella shandongensis TaxID=1734106 RepID=A0A5M6C5X6_9TREE|nr:uncharacterized protein CI109_003121 [Kwoniella shandongensis]KAA5528589.1 hypothetical protein CI109_003121 [Kwoniella shandongensis]